MGAWDHRDDANVHPAKSATSRAPPASGRPKPAGSPGPESSWAASTRLTSTSANAVAAGNVPPAVKPRYTTRAPGRRAEVALATRAARHPRDVGPGWSSFADRAFSRTCDTEAAKI